MSANCLPAVSDYCWFPRHKSELTTMLESPHKSKTGLRRVWNALFYSIAGMRAAFAHEAAFRQEVVLAALLIPLAL